MTPLDRLAAATADCDSVRLTKQLFDALIAVAREAHGVVRREEIGGYGFEGIPDLRAALTALDSAIVKALGEAPNDR